ncbi:MAG: glycoside hydrolase family protein [Collinsella sp.]
MDNRRRSHEGRDRADGITYEQAGSCYDRTSRKSAGLAAFVNVHVTEGQFVALVSLAFNVGVSYVVHQCRS